MRDFIDMPPRIAKLERDHRGFPIPWFVDVRPDTGEKDFRFANPEKRNHAVRMRKCWVCGEPCGKWLVFVVGPMCTVSRTTAEPPCHLECATFSALYCPFLTKPRMRRNKEGLEELGAMDPPGEFIERNPGTTCLWITKSFKVFATDSTNQNYLLTMGEPEGMLWYANGKPATREEADASIESGLPLLEKMAVEEDVAKRHGNKAQADLKKRVQDLRKLMDKMWGGTSVQGVHAPG